MFKFFQTDNQSR